mgnify:CR=1 FL=1
MKLGINLSIWSHAGVPFLESFSRAKNLGFRYIDLLGTGHLDPLNVNTLTIRQARDIIKDSDLYISSMIMLPRIVGNIASSNSKSREIALEYVKVCIDITKELGGRQVLMDGGERELYSTLEESWENSKGSIRECASYAMEREVIVTLELEPCMYSIVRDIPSMFRMISEVNMPNVLANVDIGHLSITRESPKELNQLRGLAIHAHISDNDGRVHANEIIGTGVTPVAEYLEVLEDIGLDKVAEKNGVVPVAGLELGLMGQYIDDPDRWAKESLQFILDKCPWITLN